jgi:LysR family hydrogen peroxide-inducible transcriptional activator
MLNPREIQYLIAIEKYKNISLAAQKCNVSQPALTMTLSKIENLFGFKIFNRQRGNINPTFLGKKVLQNCYKIEEAMLKLKNINQNEIEIKIGIIPTISNYLLAKISSRLVNLQYKFYFYDLKTSEILHKINQQEIDCAIIANYQELTQNLNLKINNLYNEELLFASNKLQPISIEKAIEEQKIILLEEENCLNFSIADICKTSFGSKSFAATNLEVIKAMIVNNNGCGILPKYCINQHDLENFNISSFKPAKFREICFIHKQDRIDKSLIDLFKI